MAWSAPISWTTGQIVTAANLNEQIRDNSTYLHDNYLPLAGGTLTGPLVAAAGAVGAPGIAFAGSLTSGFYRPAADQIAIAIAGAQAVLVTSTGATFAGAATATGLEISSANEAIHLLTYDATGDAASKETRWGLKHYTNAEEPIAMIGGSAAAAASYLWIGGAFANMNAVTEINFYTAANNTTLTGTFRGKIDSAGNWGIGMVPVRTLDVTGTFGTTGAGTIGGLLTASADATVGGTLGVGAAASATSGLYVAKSLSAGAGVSVDGGRIAGTLTKTADTGQLTGLYIGTGFTVDNGITCGLAAQLELAGVAASIAGATLVTHVALFLGTPSNGSTVRVIGTSSGAYLTTTGVWTDNPSWSHLKEAVKPVKQTEMASIFDWVRDDFAPVRYRYKTRTETRKVPVFEDEDEWGEIEVDGTPQSVRIGTRRVRVGERDEEVVLCQHQSYEYDHFGYLLDTLPDNMRQIICSDAEGGISGKDERGLLLALMQEAARRIAIMDNRVSALEAA